MLHDFLLKNRKEVLEMTEHKSLELAGSRPSSVQLKQGLPIFYEQLVAVLEAERGSTPSSSPPGKDKEGMAKAAHNSDEEAMATASGRPNEVKVAKSAGEHGTELLRLGYTLSHVVHAYGAMCQSITELATTKKVEITTKEFHDLNRCLDVAIAGAVTGFQSKQDTKITNREVEHLGFLAHELRNALSTSVMAYQLIKDGKVTIGGSTGQVLERGFKRLNELIDRSLTEVRLSVDPKVHVESGNLLQLIDQISVTAESDARSRNQTFEIQVDPSLMIETDQQLLYSALSNLVQNALKYTRNGGKIQVRGKQVGTKIEIEVEDECGDLKSDTPNDLFKPFEQQNENRKGLGLGLTIAQRAMALNHGAIEARNLPGKGCIFKITIPNKISLDKKTNLKELTDKSPLESGAPPP